MRFALCLYGQPRFYRKGYQSSLCKLIHHIESSGHTCDVFFHTWWSVDSVGKLYSKSPWAHVHPRGLIVQPNTVEDLISLYRPTKHCVDSPHVFNIDFDFSSNQCKGSPQNLYSQSYSRQAVKNLRKQHEEQHGFTYDWVINTRFDTHINVPSIPINDIVKGTIYVPPEHRGSKIFNDNLIICSSHIHDICADVIDNLIPLFKKGIHFGPECMLFAQLENYGDDAYKHITKVDWLAMELIRS